MSTNDSPPRGMAVCPVCRSNGIEWGGDTASLTSHFGHHTAREVAEALASETVRPQHAPEPAQCSAHGEMACELCSLNPGSCATEAWECEMWRDTGMHWDTCPNRIRGYAGALTYFAKKLAGQDKRQRAELAHFRLAAVKARHEREGINSDLGPTYQFRPYEGDSQ